MRRSRKEPLVRYVPPAGLGSPVWVTREQASRLDAQDQAHVAKLKRVRAW